MRYCSLCKKRKTDECRSFFNVPKDVCKRERWGEICGKKFARTSFICSDHFLPSSIMQSSKRHLLLPHAEPFVPFNVPGSDPMDMSCTELNCVDQRNKNFAINSNDTPSYITWKELAVTTKDDENLKSSNDLKFKEQETQTDSTIFSLHNDKYYDRIRQLESENKDLKVKLDQANAAIDIMKKIFTEGQIKKMKTMSSKIAKWEWKDISNAICLHAAGPRAYNHLYKQGFPLPHKSTLQRWCSKVVINEGVLNKSINFMQQTTFLKLEEKICLLALH